MTFGSYSLVHFEIILASFKQPLPIANGQIRMPGESHQLNRVIIFKNWITLAQAVLVAAWTIDLRACYSKKQTEWAPEIGCLVQNDTSEHMLEFLSLFDISFKLNLWTYNGMFVVQTDITVVKYQLRKIKHFFLLTANCRVLHLTQSS